MEKFSQFTSQGVNPFISSFDKTSTGALVACILIALLKLPLILLAVVTLPAASAISPLLPAALGLLWRRTVVRAAARLTLYALGVWHVDTVNVEKHSVRSRPSPASPRQDVTSGDVIVSNHSSWVDVLVLAVLYAPQFTRTSLEGGLRSCTVVEAMLSSLEPAPARLGPAALETVHLLVTTHVLGGTGPLVVFPEAATTNNRAVLRFGVIASQLCEAVARVPKRLCPVVHTVAIHYPAAPAQGGPSGVAIAPFTAGSPWLHLLRLAGAAHTRLSVLRPPRLHDPQPADFPPPPPLPAPAAGAGAAGRAPAAPAAPALGDSAAAPTTWAGAVQALLAQLLRARVVPIGAEEHAQFVAFHARWSRGLVGGGGGGGGATNGPAL